ncbi:penicillin-binding protein 2 [Robertmurraya korlensis]|uniref:peptidoglycan D,D-transpeptidase FtsI family protein n=1 Tax=Robertmurraya korlensis TaxID=519977 RepID=UPI00203A946B|nr:penicillin-binding protein 2 [Robertmurraya korlensis]MCM3602949.1 penicillin-binding protein 2 [Robertmurraya korlensis]
MKKKASKRRHVPLRVNLLFFIVFVLFVILIVRLGTVQMVQGVAYKEELERTNEIVVSQPVPRGKMYDRNGKIIVDNIAQKAITYTNWGASQEEMLKTAENLSELIKMDTKKVRDRDKKDYWILKNPLLVKEKITKAEEEAMRDAAESEKEFNKKYYNTLLDRITEEDLASLKEKDMQVIAIYREFASGYEYTPHLVKNVDVTDKEFSSVSENLNFLPGVDTVTDWERTYAFENTLKTILGKTTTSEEGIPAEQLDYYLSRGYSRNDRVGKSYLEYQYEDVLRGNKSKIKYLKDKSGNIVGTVPVSDGSRGKDLILTIDMDLQLAIEKILEEELLATKRGFGGTKFLDRAFVVLMDPNTGEILTMAGKLLARSEETGNLEIQDFALGNITTSYNVGSSVKGATVLTGYQTGAIAPGTPLLDAPLSIKGTPVKKSWRNMGSINDLYALEQSSNVYMFRTAIKIGGAQYVPNGPLSLAPDTFSKIRDSFAQFGLGAKTGIDLPNEMTGFKGPSTKPGFALDLVIGQYDTYTTMQLAQYAATIANGGYRIQPHIVKEIREPGTTSEKLGPIYKEIQPNILNRVSMKDEWVERVQTGFRRVMTSGTGAKAFGSAPYSPAGKTGTAQSFYDGPDRDQYPKNSPPEVMNVSLISYAPSNNPEVAMAVIVPWVYTGDTGPSPNLTIGRRVLDTYFQMK